MILVSVRPWLIVSKKIVLAEFSTIFVKGPFTIGLLLEEKDASDSHMNDDSIELLVIDVRKLFKLFLTNKKHKKQKSKYNDQRINNNALCLNKKSYITQSLTTLTLKPR